MPATHTLVTPDPEPSDPIMDQMINEVVTGYVEPATRHLLATAAGGDPVLLRALVATALGIGALVRLGGRWRWIATPSRVSRVAGLLKDRATGLTGAQLAALRAVTAPWAEPYALVAQAIGDRPSAGEPAAAVGLTRRERQILAMLGEGLTARTIARRLCLSERTVAKHQERMYRKFGTSDRLTTVLQAQRLGLLRSGAM
jgi:DNA-binding CsgD family transcriptional regulator